MVKSFAVIGAIGAIGATVAVAWTAYAADTMIKPNQVRASEIQGSSVYDRQNEDVATVKDLILDRSGKVDDVILSFGTTVGLGGKFVAVPYGSLKFDNNRLTLDQTKDQLQAMPAYAITDSNTGSGEGAVPPTGGHATNPQ